MVENNLYYGNTGGDRTIWSRVAEPAMRKVTIRGDRRIGPEAFVDHEAMDFRFRADFEGAPPIPFERIGLELDDHRAEMPDERRYRLAIRRFFDGSRFEER